MLKSDYEILGINENATLAEAKSAYHARAMETHVDHGGSDEEFMKVQGAWERIETYLTEREERGEETETYGRQRRSNEEEGRRQREWESQEEERTQEDERMRAEEEARIKKAEAKRNFVKKVRAVYAGGFAATSILFGSLYSAHYNHTLNGKIKNSTIFEYEQKQMNESFSSLVADLKRTTEHPPEKLSWENANIDYVCPNKKNLKKILQVNALNEALIKIGQKRSYDVSGLNKLDKKIDNLMINNLEGLLEGYSETASYQRAYKHTDNLITKLAEKVYRTKTREVYNNVKEDYASIKDESYNRWWHIFENTGCLLKKTGNIILRWPILGACRVVLWDAADSTLERKVSDRDKITAYENLLKESQKNVLTKYSGVKVEDYDLYKKIILKTAEIAKKGGIEYSFRKKSEKCLAKLSKDFEVTKVAATSSKYFNEINYDLNSNPSRDYFDGVDYQDIIKNIKTPEQAQFYLNNHLKYGPIDGLGISSICYSSEDNTFELKSPRYFKDINGAGKGVCTDYALAAAALLDGDGYGSPPQVLILSSKNTNASHMVYLCKLKNKNYTALGVGCNPRNEYSTINLLTKNLGFDDYVTKEVKEEYLE